MKPDGRGMVVLSADTVARGDRTARPGCARARGVALLAGLLLGLGCGSGVPQPGLVDGAQPPYGGSHQLITSYGDAGGAHGSTTATKKTNVLPDGSYRFAPVWITMMGD